MTDEADLQNALNTLRAGGIILYPTDTVWGIGCDATCDKAVDRIYGLKKRRDSKSMLALVGNIMQLSEWVNPIPKGAVNLINSSTRPLTIIYQHPESVASNLTAEDGSLGIRVCSSDFASRLCILLGRPIVSTSANISGMPTPVGFNDISEEIINGVDYVATSERFSQIKNPPSKIIKIADDDEIITIRE
ncbi:MAG: L-threonylcarbamoyladenylate synthase [Muribaculum sp.]|nr:L-threonylcarbamoyladenylate synthase [Muribaculum sp.]